VGDGVVRFFYTDYAAGGTAKVRELRAEEFLRRFLLHVVPAGFVRIRHYGLLANRTRHAKLNRVRQLLALVAAGLRKLRNIGAHADLGELTGAELPVLDDLTRAILEYVYSAPLLAREAEERFARLKKQEPKRNTTTETEKNG
jgi:hypothetical protein